MHTIFCVRCDGSDFPPPRPANNAIGNFSLDRYTSLMTIFLDNTCHNYLQRFFLNVSSCLLALKTTSGRAERISRHLLLDIVWFSLSVVNYLQKCSYHKCKSYRSGARGCKSIQEHSQSSYSQRHMIRRIGDLCMQRGKPPIAKLQSKMHCN